MTIDGLSSHPSSWSSKETADRLSAALKNRGLEIMARIDHAAAAEKAGLSLRPTELFVFGNPKAGTLLMQKEQTLGIDLPLKVLVWEDESGKTWVSYNDPAWLARRHGVESDSDATVTAMTNALIAIANEASVG